MSDGSCEGVPWSVTDGVARAVAVPLAGAVRDAVPEVVHETLRVQDRVGAKVRVAVCPSVGLPDAVTLTGARGDALRVTVVVRVAVRLGGALAVGSAGPVAVREGVGVTRAVCVRVDVAGGVCTAVAVLVPVAEAVCGVVRLRVRVVAPVHVPVNDADRLVDSLRLEGVAEGVPATVRVRVRRALAEDDDVSDAVGDALAVARTLRVQVPEDDGVPPGDQLRVRAASNVWEPEMVSDGVPERDAEGGDREGRGVGVMLWKPLGLPELVAVLVRLEARPAVPEGVRDRVAEGAEQLRAALGEGVTDVQVRDAVAVDVGHLEREADWEAESVAVVVGRGVAVRV